MRWESILGGAGEDFSKNVAAEQRDGRAFSTGRRGQEAGRSPSALDTASAKSQEGESKDRLGASVGSTGETGAGTVRSPGPGHRRHREKFDLCFQTVGSTGTF